MRPNGTDFRILTESQCGERECCFSTAPNWSADGMTILFARLRPAVMARDGTAVTDVPLAPDPPFLFGDEPSISPGGKYFAYTRVRRGRVAIWRAAIDGSQDRRLQAGYMPRWSPNGRRIAYITTTNYLKAAVWLMNARTGTPIRRIGGRLTYPLDWSPGGRRILAARSFGEQRDLISLRTDGKTAKRLTSTPKRDEDEAAWSPDGKRIAFGRVRRPNEDSRQFSLWTMRADGRRQRRIYSSPTLHLEQFSAGLYVSWQPRPAD